MRRTITLLLLLAGFSLGAAAQEILGTVTDDKKEPLVNASITVKQGSILKGSAVTDFDGKYSVKPLDPGEYDVTVNYIGYHTQTIKRVLVTPNGKTALNFVMTIAEDHATLKCVVVKCYKKPLVDKYKHSNSQLYLSSQPLSYPNPGNESYKKMPDNDFMTVKSTPVSTMSVDVDRASYTNIRRFINEKQKPPADAVRVEEMINYFDYNYAQPKGNDPVAMETDITTCPWQKDHLLLHIGLQAKTISTGDLPASNIVFLIDVSGSMMEPAKLPLVQDAMKLLTDQLREKDKVSIVVYAGNAGLVLPATSGSNKAAIKDAIDRLEGGGSTAGGAGIKLAYSVATSNFIQGGNNRVVLCTDGDFNVGVSGDNELEELIVKERQTGVFLTCLGFGMGNYKDSKMEVLADKGNGNYNYIDNINEAKKTLVKEFGGTVFTIAKDVKCQIEFNPAVVQSYRLVGYENRLLNNEDFKDDKKDAGDMGSGHAVTVLYEIVPVNINSADVRSIDPLKYQNAQLTASAGNNELATLKIRYKQPDASESSELVQVIPNDKIPFSNAGNNTSFSAAVAMFGMMLKDDKYKGSSSYESIISIANDSKGKDENKYRSEFIGLVRAQADYDAKTSAK